MRTCIKVQARVRRERELHAAVRLEAYVAHRHKQLVAIEASAFDCSRAAHVDLATCEQRIETFEQNLALAKRNARRNLLQGLRITFEQQGAACERRTTVDAGGCNLTRDFHIE